MHTYQLFNVFYILCFIAIRESNGTALSSGSAGTSDTMYIYFSLIGDIKVKYMTQLLYIDSSCGNVSSNQHAAFSFLELQQCLLTRILRFISMDHTGCYTVFIQILCQTVCIAFRPCEYKCILYTVLLQKLQQQPFFVCFVHIIQALVNLFHCS